MNNKEKYRLFCEVEKSIPIFSQAWWLDSVSEKSWDVCLVENNNEIIAAMPYIKRKSYGFTLISQPPLTQNLGPWLKYSSVNYNKRLSSDKNLMQALVDQLPKYHYFNQNWHYSQVNWLPFYWLGFQQTTRYTYVIEGLADLDFIYKNFTSSYRNKIRKAAKVVTVKQNMKPEDFFEINKKTFIRQSIEIPYTKSFFIKHDNALNEKNSREIFYAIDENGNVHSALYLTWDKISSYVHLVGEDPRYRNSGAGILLIWEAIKYTKNVLNLDVFDFEGSIIESVERVRRDCGGVQKAYHSITHKKSILFETLMFLKSLMSRR